MELRDVIETLVGLDDERRSLTNEIHRALDGLERAISPAERFGLPASKVSALRERIGLGSDEVAPLQEIGDAIRERIVEDARHEAHRALDLARNDIDRVASRLDRLAGRLGGALDRARVAFEQAGRLRCLLDRRREVEVSLRNARGLLSRDEETTELLEVVLAARKEAGAGPGQARLLLLAAEQTALEDGALAGVSANLRALREAVRAGRDESAIAADLVRRAGDAATRLAVERDDLRRELAMLARDVERRQEISHGLFQATTKASEVLERTSELGRLDPSRQVADGALGALKGACIEHGIITAMLALREVRVDRAPLDAAISELSASLGGMLALVASDPLRVARIVPAWDDLAAVDARTTEADWQAACWEAVALRKDASGVLSVAPDTLATMAAADSLDPWRDRLFQRVESKMADVMRATERLEQLDGAMTDLIEEGGAVAVGAVAVKGALARFIGEALHVMGECHDGVRARLRDPERGFAQVSARLAPFAPLEDLSADSTPDERRAAITSTLTGIRELFTQLEHQAPGADGETAAEWQVHEAELRQRSANDHDQLARVLARLTRLRSLLLPDLSAAVRDAIALAHRVSDESEAALAESGSRDRLGEALEALHEEKLVLAALALPRERRGVHGLAAERDARLLDLHGASLVLLFRLLTRLGDEMEGLEGEAAEAHLHWMDELLDLARREMATHALGLDAVLLELPDNADRLARHARVFDAYHAWARHSSESEAGVALLARHGKALYESLEAPLARLGITLLEAARVETGDWRMAGQFESLIELYSMILRRLEGVPTMTDIAGGLAASRQRAEALRDEVVAFASRSADPFTSSDGLLFRA